MKGFRAATWPRGRMIRLHHQSEVLEGNPWDDPVERELVVYLPACYDQEERAYPVLWQLAAYTNSGLSAGNWRNFSETLAQRLDRLIGSGAMGPVIVVSPDCFTTLGGNQYVNSPSVGRYLDYIHDELVPFVERKLRIQPGRDHRAVFGKSSGGYGAMQFAIRRPGFWAAIADQSGDAQFDVIFRRDFPTAAQTLARYDGQIGAFIDDFWRTDPVSGSQVHTLMLVCLAASYDPDSESPRDIRLPFDLHTLELDAARWQRWLAHDPVHQIAESVEALKSLDGIYMDCGWRDQYQIHYGCRILAREMDRLGIPCHYEEFDGSHSGIDHRLDVSLPYLYPFLKPETP